MIEDVTWDNLLDSIDEGSVLPIVGWGVTTFGPDNRLLAPWLASELATVPKTSGNHSDCLQEKVTRHGFITCLAWLPENWTAASYGTKTCLNFCSP
jgi:hypothetical protein